MLRNNLIIMLLLFILSGCDGANSATYKIGTDLPAGEYLLISYGDAYYSIEKDTTGSFDSIISNDFFSGSRYVTVRNGNYLEVRGAEVTPIADAPVQKPEDNVYKSGMYKVGRDIKAGEYKVVSEGGDAYFEVTSNSSGGFSSIVNNDNFSDSTYVTVYNGQYIKLVDCTITIK